jgi:hypothetical protein
MMKRLADGRATREEQQQQQQQAAASSVNTRPYAAPGSNPLLNGLASLALEAAQKKNAAISLPPISPQFIFPNLIFNDPA